MYYHWQIYNHLYDLVSNQKVAIDLMYPAAIDKLKINISTEINRQTLSIKCWITPGSRKGGLGTPVCVIYNIGVSAGIRVSISSFTYKWTKNCIYNDKIQYIHDQNEYFL